MSRVDGGKGFVADFTAGGGVFRRGDTHDQVRLYFRRHARKRHRLLQKVSEFAAYL
jgi:hypothetical protein